MKVRIPAIAVLGCFGLFWADLALYCSDEDVQKVFGTYVVVPEDGGAPQQTFKCLRCVFLGRDCFAVSCPDLGWIGPLWAKLG